MKGGITRVQNRITICIAELNNSLNKFQTLRIEALDTKNNIEVDKNNLKKQLNNKLPRSYKKTLLNWIEMRETEILSHIAMLDATTHLLEQRIYELEKLNEDYESRLELKNIIDE